MQESEHNNAIYWRSGLIGQPSRLASRVDIANLVAITIPMFGWLVDEVVNRQIVALVTANLLSSMKVL